MGNGRDRAAETRCPVCLETMCVCLEEYSIPFLYCLCAWETQNPRPFLNADKEPVLRGAFCITSMNHPSQAASPPPARLARVQPPFLQPTSGMSHGSIPTAVSTSFMASATLIQQTVFFVPFWSCTASFMAAPNPCSSAGSAMRCVTTLCEY